MEQTAVNIDFLDTSFIAYCNHMLTRSSIVILLNFEKKSIVECDSYSKP